MIQEKKKGLRAHNERVRKMLSYLFVLLFQRPRKEGVCIKRFAYLFFVIVASLPAQAQMLFSENLTMDIDSTKSLQGSLQPVLDFKTECCSS